MNGITIPDNYSNTYAENEVHRKSKDELRETAFNKDQNKVLDEITSGGGGGGSSAIEFFELTFSDKYEADFSYNDIKGCIEGGKFPIGICDKSGETAPVWYEVLLTTSYYEYEGTYNVTFVGGSSGVPYELTASSATDNLVENI